MKPSKDMTDLFIQALEVEGTERRLFLQKVMESDADKGKQLKDMVQEFADEFGFLEQVISPIGLEQAVEEMPDVLDEKIGPYQIIETLGQGGMGTVYLANRVDGTYEGRVAIKMMRHRDEHFLQNFTREQQILANLDHPNVAKLLDAGITPGGSPYMVMEYIEGVPLDRSCRENNLSKSQILQLFLPICDAVHHAHRRLIIHRDIKPANILVNPEGVPKLLDFGIGKILTDEAQTQTAITAMTRRYASPEQITGKPITTATDTFSLGVTLFELIYSRHPFHENLDAIWEMDKAVCTDLPSFPTLEKNRWNVGSRAVLSKAMAKDPEARYDSVQQLGDELQALIEDRPLLARKESPWDQATRFVRHHRILVSMTSLLLISMAIFITMVIREQRQTARERDRAQRITEFMLGFFEEADPNDKGMEHTSVADMLDVSYSHLKQSLPDDPDVRASMLETLGRIYFRWDSFKRSRELLERSLEISRELYPPDHPRIGWLLYFLGEIQVIEGPVEPGRRTLAEVKKIFTANYGPDSLEVARVELATGRSYLQHFDHQSALEPLQNAFQSLKDSKRENDIIFFEVLLNLGATYQFSGELDEARRYTMMAKTFHEERGLPRNSHYVALLNNLGTLHRLERDYYRGIEYLKEAAQIAEEHQLDEALMINYHTIAVFYYNSKDFDQSIAWGTKANQLFLEKLGPDHFRTSYTTMCLGKYYQGNQMPREAMTYLEKSLAGYSRQEEVPSSVLGQNMANLARVYLDLGTHQEAGDMARAALAEDIEMDILASAAYVLGVAKLQKGQLLNAELLFSRAISASRFGSSDGYWYRTMDPILGIARVKMLQGDTIGAMNLAEDLAQRIEECPSMDLRVKTKTHDLLVELFRADGRASEIRDLKERLSL